MTETTQTEQPQETEEEIEVSPLDMIEMLSDDLTTALTALKSIVRLNPRNQPGGPNNKKFGKRFQQCFDEAQQIALDAVLNIKENT